jgi:RND family efflux transporter MFP subunit
MHMTRNILPRSIPFLLVLMMSYVTAYGEQATPPGLDGITKPISDLQLSFVQPGKVQRIDVKEGDAVHGGDTLMQMEDEIELIHLKIQKASAANRVPIDMARTDLLQKQKDLRNLKAAQAKGAVTQWEVDHALLAVDAARLSLKLKEFENEQDRLKVESIVQTIKNLTLVSPADGRVEEINLEPGESVQALAPLIRIVRTNPLRIDLAVPLDQAKALTLGQQTVVHFADATELTGVITKKATVADAAATTLNIRIEVQNPQERPAGERVRVTFSRHQ